jgi:trehalose synthase
VPQRPDGGELDLGVTKIAPISPAIDSLSPKNQPMSQPDAAAVAQIYGVDRAQTVLTQVSRLDPWTDPLGVIEIYRNVRREYPLHTPCDDWIRSSRRP